MERLAKHAANHAQLAVTINHAIPAYPDLFSKQPSANKTAEMDTTQTITTFARPVTLPVANVLVDKSHNAQHAKMDGF